jgi:hypothetical protein
MSIALRLNEDLVHEAEAEALIHKRTAPKQIEYWAQIGKAVSHSASSSDLLALLQGFSQVQVTPRASTPVDPHAVFTAVERAREEGSLGAALSRGKVHYEASTVHPGLLDRVLPDGQRESGHFRNAEFTPAA